MNWNTFACIGSVGVGCNFCIKYILAPIIKGRINRGSLAKDPLFILPLIMGASMYLMQKLQPTPTDPMQAKVFQFMPIMFTFFFIMFPAGLVLYWTVNNLLSILQQWYVNRQIAAQ